MSLADIGVPTSDKNWLYDFCQYLANRYAILIREFNPLGRERMELMVFVVRPVACG